MALFQAFMINYTTTQKPAQAEQRNKDTYPRMQGSQEPPDDLPQGYYTCKLKRAFAPHTHPPATVAPKGARDSDRRPAGVLR